MKTKDVIRRLQEADPTGEEEVCVNNCDILMIDPMPAYYDGCAQIFVRPSNSDFPVGGILNRAGVKIQITPLSLEDAGFDYWSEGQEFPIEIISAGGDCSYLQERIDKWKADALEFRAKYLKYNDS